MNRVSTVPTVPVVSEGALSCWNTAGVGGHPGDTHRQRPTRSIDKAPSVSAQTRVDPTQHPRKAEILAQTRVQRAARTPAPSMIADPRRKALGAGSGRDARHRPAIVPSGQPLPGELLTVEDAARRIGMSVRYIRRLVAERRVPFYRLGRAIRIDPDDLAEYVCEGRVEPMTATSVWVGLGAVA